MTEAVMPWLDLKLKTPRDGTDRTDRRWFCQFCQFDYRAFGEKHTSTASAERGP